MKTEKHPSDRAVGVLVPAHGEARELVEADRDRDEPDQRHNDEIPPHAAEVFAPGVPVADIVGPKAGQKNEGVERSRPVVRRRIGQGPLRVGLDEVEVDPDAEGEAHAFERAEAERAPPHWAYRAETVS